MKYLYENLCFTISLVLAGSTFASEHPVFSQSTSGIVIPTIKAEGQPGLYQDIKLVLEADDQLKMLALKEGELLGDVIKEVELFQTDTFPVQVFLQVSGAFPNGCGGIGQVLQEADGNTVSIYAYNNVTWPDTASLVCTLAIRPFSHVLALDVYGLAAGTYEYRLNNTFSGYFTLAADNQLE